MIHPTAEDLDEYRREDAQDQGIAHLEERRRREPPIGDPCKKCDGDGLVSWPANLFGDAGIAKCPRCHGTKVEP